MYARNSSQVKTIVFLHHITESLARYSGGISISRAHKGDPLFTLYQDGGNTFEVVQDNIDLKIVDIETRSVIAHTLIEGPYPKVLPNKISSFTKIGDNCYFVFGAEGEKPEGLFWRVVFKKSKPSGVAVGDFNDYYTNIHLWILSYYSMQ